MIGAALMTGAVRWTEAAARRLRRVRWSKTMISGRRAASASDQSPAGLKGDSGTLLAVRPDLNNAALHRLLSSALKRSTTIARSGTCIWRSAHRRWRSACHRSFLAQLRRDWGSCSACQTTQRLLREHPVPTGEIHVNAQ